ncbi:MAG: signal peptidase I, partial [Acidimicrobiales bacterium]|nr:signal peptidase I [Acidimicrobiales bacterium]
MTARTIEVSRYIIGLVSLTVLAALTWLVLWVTVLPLARGWDSVAVTSGSMAPSVSVGDVLITSSPDERQQLDPGTIIVFENPSGAGLVTHRVVSRNPSGAYVTQGDANPRVDSTPVQPEAIRGIGKVVVPVIGTPLVWLERGDVLRLLAAAAALVVAALASRWMLQDLHNQWRARRDLPAASPNARVAAMPIGAVVLGLAIVATVANPVSDSDAAFGDPTSTANSSFAVEQWKSIIDVDGGLTHACLARTEGFVWCWGENNKGQLGDNTTVDRLTPVEVVGPGGIGRLTGITGIGSGDSFNCASDAIGGAWCWGDNADGQLGDNTKADSMFPVPVVGPGGSGTLSGVAAVAAGDTHACA